MTSSWYSSHMGIAMRTSNGFGPGNFETRPSFPASRMLLTVGWYFYQAGCWRALVRGVVCFGLVGSLIWGKVVKVGLARTASFPVQVREPRRSSIDVVSIGDQKIGYFEPVSTRCFPGDGS